MKETTRFHPGMKTTLNVEECLRGVGLELLILAEEYIYASKPLNEEEVARLGSDLYLLATVLGSILRERRFDLKIFSVTLPEDVGAIVIHNPYYDRRSETPDDKASGRSDGSVGEFPF